MNMRSRTQFSQYRQNEANTIIRTWAAYYHSELLLLADTDITIRKVGANSKTL